MGSLAVAGTLMPLRAAVATDRFLERPVEQKWAQVRGRMSSAAKAAARKGWNKITGIDEDRRTNLSIK